MKAKKGDIFVSIWGYDQTNATFFQVMKTTAKSVKVKKLQKKTVADKDGFMTGVAIPLKNKFDKHDGQLRTKRLYLYDGRERFQAGDSYGSAEKWNGKPVAISWYG